MCADSGMVTYHPISFGGTAGDLLHKLSLQSQLSAAHVLEALHGEGERAL